MQRVAWPLLALLLSGCGIVESTVADAAPVADAGVDGCPAADAATSSADGTDPNLPACPWTGDNACSKTTAVAGCLTSSPCTSTVTSAGDTPTLRISRLRLTAPASMLALTKIALDPYVAPRCARPDTGESLNWLLRLDRAHGMLTTGAGVRDDAGRYSFATIPATTAPTCAGFAPSTFDLTPSVATITNSCGAFSTSTIARVNLPNGDWALPLVDVRLHDVTTSANDTCIGAFYAEYYCNDSLGWLTAGTLDAKITLEDADRVPVPAAGCASLCKLLVNNSTLTDGDRCKRDASGAIVARGDSCSHEGYCSDSLAFRAYFAAYAVDTP
jgi:hypothetical protein